VHSPDKVIYSLQRSSVYCSLSTKQTGYGSVYEERPPQGWGNGFMVFIYFSASAVLLFYIHLAMYVCTYILTGVSLTHLVWRRETLNTTPPPPPPCVCIKVEILFLQAGHDSWAKSLHNADRVIKLARIWYLEIFSLKVVKEVREEKVKHQKCCYIWCIYDIDISR